jgi:hypothetical protein
MPLVLNSSSITGVSSITGLTSGGLYVPGHVMQVKQTVRTDTFSASLNTGEVSGDAITVTITPASASSKVLVQFNGVVGNSNIAGVMATLYKNGTKVSGLTGDGAGSRQRISSSVRITESGTKTDAWSVSFSYLDSPATTSEITYSMRIHHASGEVQTLYLNRSHADPDTAYGLRAASTITVTEIAA